MILRCRDKRTSDFVAGRRVKHFFSFEHAARLKMDRLEAAASSNDLAVLPGNRLQALKPDGKARFGIPIGDRWRICFGWNDGATGPSNVEIVDH
jgi:toxin HigB-1